MDNVNFLCRNEEATPELFVYGDFFNSDTRTVICILQYCDFENIVIKEVDTLLGEDGEISASRKLMMK